MYIIADHSHIPIRGGTPMKKGYVIPLKEKFAYGSGDLAVNLAFDSINFYMLWFIVTVAGISPGMAGAIFFIARVWMLSPIIIWVVFQIIRHLLLEEEGHTLCLVQFRWGSFSWHYGLCHR